MSSDCGCSRCRFSFQSGQPAMCTSGSFSDNKGKQSVFYAIFLHTRELSFFAHGIGTEACQHTRDFLFNLFNCVCVTVTPRVGLHLTQHQFKSLHYHLFATRSLPAHPGSSLGDRVFCFLFCFFVFWGFFSFQVIPFT